MSEAEHSASRKVVESSEPQSLDVGTEYIVLKMGSQQDTGGVKATGEWHEVGKFSARTPDLAMRKYADKALANAGEDDPGVILRAIPTRYWPVLASPYKVKVERTLVIGG